MLLGYQAAPTGCDGAPRVRLAQIKEIENQKCAGWKHAPERVGNSRLNNGVSRPDGDSQSLRDSVCWHVESTANLNSYTCINIGLQRARWSPNNCLRKVSFSFTAYAFAVLTECINLIRQDISSSVSK